MASIKHTHKYHRLNDGLWHCALPDCSHYMPKNVAGATVGKRSVCWHCNTEFILDEIAMQDDKPSCIKCRLDIADNLTDSIIPDLNRVLR